MYCSIDFIMDYFIVLGWGGCSGFNGGKSIAVDKWNDIIIGYIMVYCIMVLFYRIYCSMYILVVFIF